MTSSRDASPFGGLRVVEFASGFAGPLAGMMFADYGADVVKVEPPNGDWARPSRGFQMWNRGKRSVVLDLKDASSREPLQALLAGSDVVITNYRPGVADRLGIGADAVRARNAAAVYCTISGFGPLAAYRDRKAYDGIVLAKAGRMMGLDALSGASPSFAGDRPIYSAAPVASYAAAHLAFQGAVAALLERERTGAGRHVETSLISGLITATMRQDFRRSAAAVPGSGQPPASGQSVQLRGIALTFLTAECGDGKWIQMCARQDHHFRSWLRALGLHDVLADPRYAGGPLAFNTIDDIEELELVIRKRMRDKPQPEWIDQFIAHDVGADPFLTFDEFLDHPQMTATGRVTQIADPQLGTVKQLGPLVVMDPPAPAVERGAPRLGEHTGAIDWSAPTHRASGGSAPRGPLAGVTAVELATYLAGPLGATILAEMGARVIKIEPLEGDPFRRVGLQFVHLQHGKESIALNLKSEQGKQILRRLVRDADVFLHNFRLGPIDRLGCDYASIQAINPRIVYVNAAAYGSRGPQSQRTAFHSTPNALCGGGVLQAGRGNPPVDDSYPDPCAGAAVASAILLGLFARLRDRAGCYLETTMLCSAGYVHSENLVSYEGAPPHSSVDPGQRGLHALYRLYACSAGWLFVAAPSEAEWARFADVLGHAEWCADDRFASAPARRAFDTDLAELVAEALRADTADAWEERLAAADVGAVRADATEFEEFVAGSGLASADDHPEHGAYWRLAPRVTFDGAKAARGAATLLGESTVALLTELGYSVEEISALCADGVVLDGGPDTPARPT